MAKIKVIKGDSTRVKEFTITGYPDISGAAWVGRKVVSTTLGATPTLDTAMVKDSGNTLFLGYLTPAETDALAVGTYSVTYEITNLSILPQFRREMQYALEITQEGIAT